jgi:hypothetical protein
MPTSQEAILRNASRLSDITLQWMVEFITEKMPEANRVIVDNGLLRTVMTATPNGPQNED